MLQGKKVVINVADKFKCRKKKLEYVRLSELNDKQEFTEVSDL